MVTQVKQSTFDDLVESMEPTRVKDGWCHNNMMFVEYGSAYALADNGATVCLGPMPEVEKYLKYGIEQGLHPVAVKILNSIKNMEAEIARRESVNTVITKLPAYSINKRNSVRVRPVRNSRNNARHIKPAKVRKKPTLYSVGP